MPFKGGGGVLVEIQGNLFKLLTFPCREMIRLSIHNNYLTCFQNESIYIQKTHFLCHACIYIYNSVLTRRHIHINSSASTPPNATKIAEMKDSHHGQVIVGPELLFSIYKCCFLEFVCAR